MTRPRKRRSRAGTAVLALLVAAAFVIGVALGAALDDNPEPATTTFERRLTVMTLTATP